MDDGFIQEINLIVIGDVNANNSSCLMIPLNFFQNYTIPADEQFTVEATDVIGLFYPKGRHARIIPSQNIRKVTTSQ